MAQEDTLIYRAQAGDEGAFADLMRGYYSLIYTIVIRIVDNPHDVEEVVQDTFLSAYQGLTQLEDTTKIKSWLAEIARNCARQWGRKQRINTVSLDEVGEGVLQTEDSPDERLERQEQRELIRRTMETLPQKDRDIARAFYLEGASYEELTSTHGLSYNAIAFRLFHIKRKLSKRLRYFLTGVFISPGLTLKKLYTRGLNVMKVGTVPKITIGAAALVAVIFIGFVGIRQMNAPTVEERVYLLPWEAGTARPQNRSERFLANTTQDAESRNNLPQITATASTAVTEPIDGLFGEPDEIDMTQFATEPEFGLGADQDFTTNISASPENTGQSAEDVMYAFVEAWRNADYKVMLSLMTEQYRRSVHDDLGGGNSINMSDEVVETRRQMLVETLRELRRQSSLVSREYVGDEFHFRLRIPALELLGISDQRMPMFTCLYQQVKMRKENGVWRIYVAQFDHVSR